MQLRYGADYGYKNLCVRVESWSLCDSIMLSVDTLYCPIYDDKGRRVGSTVGAMYQSGSETMPLTALCTDTLLFKVSHIMDANPLQDIFDIGVRLTAVKR